MALIDSYDKIIKYVVEAECTEPLHIGSADGDTESVLIHPIDHVPFIQASSIAGVFRVYFEQVYKSNETENIFGDRTFTENSNASEKGSKVRFTDGIFFNEGRDLKLELRPRVSIDPVSGTCKESLLKGSHQKSGHKFNMEYIGAGARFRFQVYLYDKEYKNKIEDIFAAMNQRMIQFGGQKSNGCGYIKVQHLLCKEFDMTKINDRQQWYEEDELKEQDYTDITKELSGDPCLKNAFEVAVEGCTEGELLIKSISVSEVGKNAADSENIRNAKGDYIVPGSSLKGALRSQMEKITAYLQENGAFCEDIIDDAFGKKSMADQKGRTGNLFVCDTVVGEQSKNMDAPLSRRIHIDKFTGGVMQGGLFSEKNISGDMQIQITIKNKNHPDKTCAILLMALRDLAIGAMSVGGGYNIGKGMISVKKVTLKDIRKGRVAVLDFDKNKIQDDEGVIRECLEAIQKG